MKSLLIPRPLVKEETDGCLIERVEHSIFGIGRNVPHLVTHTTAKNGNDWQWYWLDREEKHQFHRECHAKWLP
jgi:hypothetical protein